MQTITMTAILQKMRDCLVASTALGAWCTTKYGKAPKIYVGIDIRTPPDENSMPHIVLLPAPKEEGLEQSVHTYRVYVAWAIEDATVTTTGNVIEHQGLYDCDTLGQMIWTILAGFSTNCPASRVEYDLDGETFVPIFPGVQTIEIHVPVAIGGNITL